MTEATNDVPAVSSAQASAQRVRSATGLMARANELGLLAAADVHVTLRMVRMCGEDVSETAQFATAMAVRAVRQGSTCLALFDVAELVATELAITGSAVAPGVAGAVDDPRVALDIPTAQAMTDALRTSALVVGGTDGPLRPLVLMNSVDGPLLYLRKYFQQEEHIRSALAVRASTVPVVDGNDVIAAVESVFTNAPDALRQQAAAVVAATRWTSVLTGGPGTGKTTTVARILAVLSRLETARLHVAVCAPTGRAVAQLQSPLDVMRAMLTEDDGDDTSGDDTSGDDTGGGVPPVHAVTVHGLLGWRPGAMPRYGRGNRLPHDVVVVDETSMLSMTAMSHLLEAVRPDARLILVGDPHQLASVEAGAVLADLVERDPQGSASAGLDSARPDSAGPDSPWPDAGLASLVDRAEMSDIERRRLNDGIVALTRNYRNDAGIAAVAAAVNDGDADRVLELLASESHNSVELVAAEDLSVRDGVVEWAEKMFSAARQGAAIQALDALDSHRVLCAHREGVFGVRGWTRRIMQWCAEIPGHPPPGGDVMQWEAGRPVLITANDRQSQIFNGDCGVVIGQPRADPPTLAFAMRRSESATPDLISPNKIADATWAYAMTIHRSQGSQFDNVTVVLPPAESALLTRELLYTAITRAKSHVRIVGTEDMLRAAVERRVHRASGLRSAISPLD